MKSPTFKTKKEAELAMLLCQEMIEDAVIEDCTGEDEVIEVEVEQ